MRTQSANPRPAASSTWRALEKRARASRLAGGSPANGLRPPVTLGGSPTPGTAALRPVANTHRPARTPRARVAPSRGRRTGRMAWVERAVIECCRESMHPWRGLACEAFRANRRMRGVAATINGCFGWMGIVDRRLAVPGAGLADPDREGGGALRVRRHHR